MQDWTAGQLRYLIHFDDGGSGMRMRDEPLRPAASWTTAAFAMAWRVWSRTGGQPEGSCEMAVA